MSVQAAGSKLGVGGGVSQVVQFELQTIGAVAADFIILWPQNRAAAVKFIAVASNSTRTVMAALERVTSVQRGVGNVILGTETALWSSNSGLAVTTDFLISAPANLFCRVNGAAGQTLTWNCTVLIYSDA